MSEFGISHERADDSLEANARWFATLSRRERMAYVVWLADMAIKRNPDLLKNLDVRQPSERIQIVERP